MKLSELNLKKGDLVSYNLKDVDGNVISTKYAIYLYKQEVGYINRKTAYVFGRLYLKNDTNWIRTPDSNRIVTNKYVGGLKVNKIFLTTNDTVTVYGNENEIPDLFLDFYTYKFLNDLKKIDILFLSLLQDLVTNTKHFEDITYTVKNDKT